MSSSLPQGNPPPPHSNPAYPPFIEHLQSTNDGKRNPSRLERQTKFGRRTSKTGYISTAVHEASSNGIMYPRTFTLNSLSSSAVSSPPLNHVQETPTIEQAILALRTHRLAEYQQEVYIAPLAKPNPRAPDTDVFPLMDKVREFLAGNRHVMLILGDSGAGKSTFNRHLENQLWRDYRAGDRIPLYINLPALDRPDKTLVAEQLATLDFTENQIYELKRTRRLLLICDGYDESQLTVNLHNSNRFNTSGQWDTKLVISCRSQYLGQDYRDRFVPSGGGHYKHSGVKLFQEAVIAPFSTEQIKNYVEQYVPLEPRTWCTEDYMDKLATIPNLMELVKNPFLLSLALEALPGVIEGKQDLSTIKITRAQLYDTFVEHWSNVNKRRLQSNTLTTADRIVFNELLDMGFVSKSIDYSTRLALAIFEQHGGNPIVQYVHDKDSWKTQFFGQDAQVRLLRDSSPLTRTGNLHQFLHRSMLEYFFSRAIFDPSSHGGDDESTPQTNPVLPDDHP
ncbi:WD_REPEATS_REGION domain-containing protein, partial [Linnemannia elongata]